MNSEDVIKYDAPKKLDEIPGSLNIKTINKKTKRKKKKKKILTIHCQHRT